MDEQSWLTESNNFWPLIRTAAARCSSRKLRLFACACAWQVVPLIKELDAEAILETAGWAADNDPEGINAETWLDEYHQAHNYRLRVRGADQYAAMVLEAAIGFDPQENAVTAIEYLMDLQLEEFNDFRDEPILSLIREVFENPFRPIDFTPWRTDTAVGLARQMYVSREFGAMPILADALQDAGCDNTDVLSHCRDANQTHVRGCWLVDGVLGKE